MWEKAHERNARRVLNLMIELEGLWVKLGQYLSTRADVLPEAYIRLLKQLQDALPPRPLEEVFCFLFLQGYICFDVYLPKEKKLLPTFTMKGLILVMIQVLNKKKNIYR